MKWLLIVPGAIWAAGAALIIAGGALSAFANRDWSGIGKIVLIAALWPVMIPILHNADIG